MSAIVRSRVALAGRREMHRQVRTHLQRHRVTAGGHEGSRMRATPSRT
jgi:hypothetical protein